MEIRLTQEQGRVPITVFHIKGDINVESYEQLQDKAREAHAAGTRNLVLDLSEVPYMSSVGIRALNNIFTLLRSDAPEESGEAIRKGISDGTFKSPHLKLVNPTKPVLSTISMTGLDMFIEIHQQLKDAVASF